MTEALSFAVSRVVDDPDPLNEREAADGHQYVMRMLTAVAESSLLTVDPQRPAFLPMLESVRYLGASGPDIDYDVALILPGVRYRVSGSRGDATFVGIAAHAQAGDQGASEIVAAVDVDDLIDAEGSFVYEFDHPAAARVIVRQYFHDRSTQPCGSWVIETVPPATKHVAVQPLPTVAGMAVRVADAAESLRWNAQLNELWSPERRSNLNDRQVAYEPDGSVRLFLADGDPGHPNWLDTSGHRVGAMFFRWLHADPPVLPVCRIVRA